MWIVCLSPQIPFLALPRLCCLKHRDWLLPCGSGSRLPRQLRSPRVLVNEIHWLATGDQRVREVRVLLPSLSPQVTSLLAPLPPPGPQFLQDRFVVVPPSVWWPSAPVRPSPLCGSHPGVAVGSWCCDSVWLLSPSTVYMSIPCVNISLWLIVEVVSLSLVTCSYREPTGTFPVVLALLLRHRWETECDVNYILKTAPETCCSGDQPVLRASQGLFRGSRTCLTITHIPSLSK